MTPNARRLWLIAAIVFAALPLAFGVIRAVKTGSDLRYLWLAGAAIAGSMVAMPPARGSTGAARVSLGRTLGAVAAGAICAAAAAMLTGASAGLGLAIVAISFGLCTGTAAACLRLARAAAG